LDNQLPWIVAHSRPRCEKKIVEFCKREGIPTTLPLYRSVKKYRGKSVVFHKPLFPGYVFARAAPGSSERRHLLQSDHVANLLDPPDQAEFESQLGAILLAIESEHEIRLVPAITEGQKVSIRSGPLRGLEGVVFRRKGVFDVVLRLDFIGQAAAVTVSADELEPN
jgi:transcription antitermination factor NusG